MAHTRRLIVALALAAVALAQTPFQNIGNMSQLMVNMIYPASDAIFYVERNPPAKDAEWNQLQYQALVLAESGNLLMLPGRARDQEKWMADAKLMVDVGAAAYKAAKAKDLPAIVALNDQLNTACVTCHTDYRDAYRRRREAQQKQDAQQKQPK